MAAAAFVPAPSHRGYSAQLVWGVHGWLLLTDNVIRNQVWARDLHVLRHQEGAGLYEGGAVPQAPTPRPVSCQPRWSFGVHLRPRCVHHRDP